MRVLVIGHCTFSKTGNMGKTLSSYFEGFAPSEIADFYIHSEVPTCNACENYYRVTDKEIIKSIFGIKCGTIFTKTDIRHDLKTSRVDSGNEAKLYQSGRKRTPLIYFLRNAWWKLGHWNNKKFKKWVDEFSPDCVFFASGDYSFMYNIAFKVAKKKNIPLYISCMDDYYLNNKNANKFFGRILHNFFMKQVKRTVDYSSALFCICDKMASDYQKLFNKKCYTLHTAASFSGPLSDEKKNAIVYIGNLGYNRHNQLVQIGRTLKTMGGDICHLDVYSSEKRSEILKKMIAENGICFHGSVSSDEVKSIMAKSIALVHTESFDEKCRQAVKYSISTKIADSLMSGTCLFAFGPEEVASMQYLRDNCAAICAFSPEELQKQLELLIHNDSYREQVTASALLLAKKNHQQENASQIIKKAIL